MAGVPARPTESNAIDWTMLREIGAALKAHLEDPGVRVVVIASALEKFFSTGADLRVLQAMRPGRDARVGRDLPRPRPRDPAGAEAASRRHPRDRRGRRAGDPFCTSTFVLLRRARAWGSPRSTSASFLP